MPVHYFVIVLTLFSFLLTAMVTSKAKVVCIGLVSNKSSFYLNTFTAKSKMPFWCFSYQETIHCFKSSNSYATCCAQVFFGLGNACVSIIVDDIKKLKWNITTNNNKLQWNTIPVAKTVPYILGTNVMRSIHAKKNI